MLGRASRMWLAVAMAVAVGLGTAGVAQAVPIGTPVPTWQTNGRVNVYHRVGIDGVPRRSGHVSSTRGRGGRHGWWRGTALPRSASPRARSCRGTRTRTARCAPSTSSARTCIWGDRSRIVGGTGRPRLAEVTGGTGALVPAFKASRERRGVLDALGWRQPVCGRLVSTIDGSSRSNLAAVNATTGALAFVGADSRRRGAGDAVRRHPRDRGWLVQPHQRQRAGRSRRRSTTSPGRPSRGRITPTTRSSAWRRTPWGCTWPALAAGATSPPSTRPRERRSGWAVRTATCRRSASSAAASVSAGTCRSIAARSTASTPARRPSRGTSSWR